MRSDEIGLRDIVWCWAWAIGSLLAVTYFGDFSLASIVPLAVRALLWAIPIGIVLFGVLMQTHFLKAIPGRWMVAAWIVLSVVAGIPEITGGYDETEVCYDKQGAYSC